ncbi:MAG: IS1182 family transposase [Paracoccaceae bacterium]
MKRYIEGTDRDQGVLFPDHLEDWIGEDNPVRAIDVFVEGLDLGALGFERSAPERTGRPGYRPAVLLKLYIYGYLNRVQSSRRLEREAGRNVEVMWLTGRLVPDHKTIADFRKTNGAAIGEVSAAFVELCRRVGLLSTPSVAIDGSKFKAVNNRDRNFTSAKMQRRLAQIEESVARYLRQLDSADRQAPTEALEKRKTRLREKLERLRAETERLDGLKKQMEASPDGQISLTDPDARSMATSGRGSGVVGYNVQAAVDTENHLIVAHDVVTTGSDRSQLSGMAMKAKAALGVDELAVVADRGYFKSEEILACDRAGIAATLPKPVTSSATKAKRYGKEDFRYFPDEDVYRCPAGETLIYRYTSELAGLMVRYYWTSHCEGCALKAKCTPAPQRRVYRWEHQEVLDAVQRRLDEDPQAMRRRRETVEHPFGTIKAWMGATHFLTKTLLKASTEIDLSVLAYNLRRALTLLGPAGLARAIRV